MRRARRKGELDRFAIRTGFHGRAGVNIYAVEIERLLDCRHLRRGKFRNRAAVNAQPVFRIISEDDGIGIPGIAPQILGRNRHHRAPRCFDVCGIIRRRIGGRTDRSPADRRRSFGVGPNGLHRHSVREQTMVRREQDLGQFQPNPRRVTVARSRHVAEIDEALRLV